IGSLFDDEIATTVGIKKGVTGGAAPADQMRTMIAYSAIDDGTRPFGDTGIRALFNDAQGIGQALGAENASQVLKDAANPLSNIHTQFAGQLAFGDVLASSTQQPVRDGVISLSDDEQTLAVDFNKDLWSIGAQGGSAPDRIIGQTELTDQIFESVGETPFYRKSNIKVGMKWLWGDDTIKAFDRYVIAAKDGPLNTTIQDRQQPASDPNKAALVAAGSSSDEITGSRDNDLILGGAGDDTLRGAKG